MTPTDRIIVGAALVSLFVASAPACKGHKVAPPPPPTGRADEIARAPGAPASPTLAAHAPASAPADAPLCVTPWRPFRLDLPHLEHLGALPAHAEIGAGKWTWITLWAAWCKPCKEELPRLVGWSQQLGFRLLPISLDDDRRELTSFLAAPAAPVKASYWMTESDARARFLGHFGLQDPPALPEQLLVDPHGVVRCLVSGAVGEADLGKVQAVFNPPPQSQPAHR